MRELFFRYVMNPNEKFNVLRPFNILILSIGLLCSPALYAGKKGATVQSIDSNTREFALPSKQPDGAMIELKAFWFQAARPAESLSARMPAVALFHGCGGPYNSKGELSERMREYIPLLNAEGYHVLIVDSLSARGEKELCTQKLGKRKVTQSHRALDALAAMQWMSMRPEVDADRMALLGWSNGGSTVLAATNASRDAVRVATLKPRAAIAFYPGCDTELKRGYEPTAPLLLMVGELDDWTPAAPCKDLASRSRSEEAPIQLHVMPGVYHGFDSNADMRVRTDVPNGTQQGKGVHVGGNEEAKTQSRALLKEFLKQIL